MYFFFFFTSRGRHTSFDCDWSSDVSSPDPPEGGVGGPRRCRDDDDPVASRVLHDLGHTLQCRGRRNRGAAELQDGPRHAFRCAIWITSPSIADAVASPPAPGPLQTKRGTRSLSSVITFVGPVA